MAARRVHAFPCLRLLLCAVAFLGLRRISPTAARGKDYLAHGALLDRTPEAARALDSLGHWLCVRPNGALTRSTRIHQPQVLLLLLLAGDVSSNPGPCPSCLRCDRAIHGSVAALQCDKCDAWLHRKCELLSLRSYRRLSSTSEKWYCGTCQLPAFDDSLFPSPAPQCCTPKLDPVTVRAPSHGHPDANLAVWFSNVRSVKNKLLDFQVLVASSPQTVFAICETWLDPSVPDGLLVDTTRHVVHRKDREGRGGGGVMFVTPRHLACRRRRDFEVDGLEALFVEIAHKRGKVLLGCVYCPPATRAVSYNLLSDTLERIVVNSYLNISILGDFNAHVDWTDISAPIPSAPHDDALLDVMEANGFIQVCDEPSYCLNAQKASFLDLAFITNPALVSSCSLEPSLDGSDHKAIHLESLLSLPKFGRHARKVKLFSQIDVAHLNNLVHLAPWVIATDELQSASDAYDNWLDLVSAIEKECVPTKTATGRQRSPWITENILRLSRQKRKLFRRAKKTHNSDHINQARQAQRDLKKAIYTSHRSYVETIAQKAIKSPKLFWSYVNRQRKSSSPPEFTVGGAILHSPHAVAELFSAQFSSAWTVPGTQKTADTLPPPHVVPLENVEINADDVIEAVRHLKPSQSAGPDGVHPMLLKAGSERLSTVLARLFTNFLQAGSVPHQWKLALITPVHKGNGAPTSSVASYRPISTTSIVCRTMERILNKRLLQHLEQHSLLSPCQHGFRPGRSCESALASTVHMLSSSLDERVPCQLLQLDFKQAFDRVDHIILRQKMSKMGITGCLMNWISDFLLDRSQRVIFQGAVSTSKQVLSGIPQGSVLGPTLFNIFINDVTSSLQCTPLLYADDLTIIHPAQSPIHYQQLQDDLNTVHTWSIENRLPLNIKKCTSTLISTSRGLITEQPSFLLNGVVLPVVDRTRLLGVTIDPKLTFAVHIGEVTSRARRLLGFVLRVTRGTGPGTLRHLYTALVLPHLEYCASVWDPPQTALTASLESVQRRAAYSVLRRQASPGLPRYRDLPTQELLKMVGWSPLALRRQVASLRLLASTLLPSNSTLSLVGNLRHTRSGGLQPLFGRTVRHRNSFLIRTTALWRSLPTQLTQCPPQEKDDIKAWCAEALDFLRQ